MINLNDDKMRQELIGRYLNAKTTLEEERMLANFLSDADITLSAEEEDVLLLLQSSILVGQMDITTDKADEFDLLMQKGCEKKSRFSAMRWVASVAAVVIGAVLLFPVINMDRTEEKPETTRTTPTKAVAKAEQKTKSINANKTTDKKVPRHKSSETTTEKQSRMETPEVNDISTTELLETVRILSGIKTNDIIITASSSNEGFVVKTMDLNGSSTSYMLKRCSDGTSIELKTQPINFKK